MGEFQVLVLLVFFLFRHSGGQVANTTGYTCDATSFIYPCETYVFYRANSPNFLDLAAIGDLFGVSRVMIAQPSNISSPSALLFPDQPLLVPVSCSCNPLTEQNTTSISYANISYTIKSGDTLYLLSTFSFQNLTTYQSVELVNPTLIPTNLEIGQRVSFPIFCRCPNRTQANYLISYVYQPSDNLSSVASLLNASINTDQNDVAPFDTIFVPVSQLPSWRQPSVNATAEPPAQAVATRTVDRKGVITGLGVGLGACGLLTILTLTAWGWRERTRRKKAHPESERKWRRNYKAVPDPRLMVDVSASLDKYKVFSFDELGEATRGFAEDSRVGGSVYKGWISGEIYAIKLMTWDAREELKILQKVNHGSLVKLEGFCIDPEEFGPSGCYLVYEYVDNGSLYTWLCGGKLSWKSRVGIAVDVANGLQYIHEHTRPRVVHKDIRSSNILLDSNLRAKIANFGLAKSGHNATTKHIVGTQGYMAPEYLTDGVVSTKMDVFALGVVLLELVSGRQAVDDGGRLIWALAVEELAMEKHRAKRVREWLDATLVDEECPMDSVLNMVAVAMACLQRDPEKRPSAVEIVYALSRSEEPLSFDDTSNDAVLSGTLLAR